MNYKIVCKKDDVSLNVCQQLRQLINKEESDHPDVIFTIGGDGTFLDAVRLYLERIDEVFFVAIHTGTLGFYTQYLPNQLQKMLADLNNKTIETYNLLELKMNGEVEYALNEVTLSAHHQLLEGDIFIDDEHLMKLRANGVCVSTPTGSTAYNKSLKGAVMDPKVNALQLALIAPFETTTSRMISPLVLSKHHKIIFKPMNAYLDITFDRLFLSKENIESIQINYSNKYVKTMINPQNAFIKRVKEKFIGN